MPNWGLLFNLELIKTKMPFRQNRYFIKLISYAKVSPQVKLQYSSKVLYPYQS